MFYFIYCFCDVMFFFLIGCCIFCVCLRFNFKIFNVFYFCIFFLNIVGCVYVDWLDWEGVSLDICVDVCYIDDEECVYVM